MSTLVNKKVKYICPNCGGDNIFWDAWAYWDVDDQHMYLENAFDQAFCVDCDGEVSEKEVSVNE